MTVCVSDPTCDTCSDHGVDSNSQLTVKKKGTVSPWKCINNKEWFSFQCVISDRVYEECVSFVGENSTSETGEVSFVW